MPTRRIVTVGASAGGVESLVQLVSRLPADLPAAIFVVLHIPPSSTSRLPQILANAGHLRAVQVDAPQRIRRGQIYVAPPDRHLIIEDGRVRSSLGPRENGHRPAVDPLAGRVARRAKQRGHAGVADGYGGQHRDAATDADRLRTVLNKLPRRSGDSTTGTPGAEVRHNELDEQPGSELGGSASGRLPPDLK